MKQLYLLLFTLTCQFSFSQEWYGYQILEFGDTINFEEESIFIEIDTAESNLWQIGAPSKLVFDQARSPANAMVTDTLNSYLTSNISHFDLIFPPEDYLQLYEQVYFGFSHKYDTDTLKDGGYITISVDNGETFYPIFEPVGFYDSYPEPFWNSLNIYSEDDTLFNGERGYSGSSDGWVNTMMGWNLQYLSTKDLGAPKGGWDTDTLRIRFNFISDTISESKDGWMIDDIYFFTVDIPSNVLNQYQLQYKVFPNPATDKLFLETEKSYQRLELEVRAITSQEAIYHVEGSGDKISLENINLEMGVYLLTLHGDGEFLGTARCVMQR